jgi:hypothetical protein
MTGKGQLGGGREDADASIAAVLGREQEDALGKFISWARRCIWSSLSDDPSSNTASWFPCSGVSVNTSTIT